MIEIDRGEGRVDELSWNEFEEAVRRGDVGPDARLRFPAVTGERFVTAESLEAWQSLVDAPRTRFERSFDIRRPPVAVLATSALLLGVFLWQLQDATAGAGMRWMPPPGGIDGATLLRQGAKSLPHQLELGEWWRLLTASFLHVHWWHFAPNLAYLLYVGRNVEAVLGKGGTALLLVATAVGSMGMSSLATPQPSVGASGIVFGVFGAAVALGWRVGPWIPLPTRKRFGWAFFPFIVWFLALGVLNARAIDHFCHLGGLAVGVALGLTLPPAPAERPGSGGAGALRFTAAVALAGLVGVAVPLLARAGRLPTSDLAERAVAAEVGVSLRVPGGWEAGRGEHDADFWRSPTGAARLSVGGWVEPWRPAREPSVRARWEREQLARYGAVEVPRASPDPAALGLPPGWFVQEADVVAGGRLLRAVRAGRIRGSRVVTVEFLHPVDRFDDYALLRRRVWGTLEERRPAALERAAAAGTASEAARVGWALEAALTGEREEAERVLGRAEDASGTGVRYVALWIAAHLGGDGVPDLVGAARLMALDETDPPVVRVQASVRELVLAHEVLGAGDPAAAAIEAELLQRDPELAEALAPEAR